MLTSNTRKKALTATILLALTIALIPVFTPNLKLATAAEATSIKVLPQTNVYYANETSPGDVFILNMTVVNVTDLQNWQTRLEWDPNVLDFVNASLPSDNVFAGAGRAIITPPTDNGTGYVIWGATYINSPYWTFNGTGTLCQIAMMIRTPTGTPPWTSDLNITNVGADTFLIDGPGFDISFDTVDGAFAYNDFLSLTLSPSGISQVNYGQPVLFTATAINGSLPYAYNWFFKWPNGTEIEVTSAVNSTTWTSYGITEYGDHKVTVEVTDNLGLQTNATSILRLVRLAMTLGPSPISANVGDSVPFTITVSGGIPPYEIRWFRNETEITSLENSTAGTLTFPTVGLENILVNATDSGDVTVQKTVAVPVFATPTVFINVVPATGTGTFYSNMTGVGDTVTFNVTVADVTDLQNWQVKLTWDPALLNYSSVTIPVDNVFAASGYSLITAVPIVEADSVVYGATYINENPYYWSFNGTGVLFQIELEIVHQPASPSNSSVIAPADLYYPLGTSILDGANGNTIPILGTNATCTYVLVSPVTHQLFGKTFWTYTDTSIIANDTDYFVNNVQHIAWIDMLGVTGAPGSTAWINFTLPKTLIWLFNPTDQWKVFQDNVDVTSQALITSDATNTYISIQITFVGTSSVVRVQGTAMVPEQLPLLIIALLMGSLIVVILAKAAPRKKWIKH